MLLRTLDRSNVAVAAVGVVVIGGAILVARTGSDAGFGTTAILVVLLLLALLVAFRVARLLAGVDPEAVDIAGRFGGDADQQRLLARWLQRARWGRNVGGLAGLTFWLFGTSTQGDVLVYGVGGVALGAIAAELHHVTPTGGPRTARLEPRSIDEYLMTADRRRMIVAALGALVVATLGVVIGGSMAPTLLGLAALAVLALTRAVQQQVATRARPAIADRLRRADDFARELAIGRGLARPATYFALALIARGCFILNDATQGAGGLVGIGVWIYAAVLWWNNRRLGLDFVLRSPQPVLA